MSAAAPRPTYIVRLKADKHVANPTQALRAALKILLRRFGLRAVSIEQEGGMTELLDPRRLAKLCGMFGSDHDGEVFNAARMADRLVRDAGLTWADVITTPAVNSTKMYADLRRSRKPPPDWRNARAFCMRHACLLSTKEYDFIVNLGRWRGEITPRQREWLEAIHDRLQREAA